MVGEWSTHLKSVYHPGGVGIENLTISQSLAGCVHGLCAVQGQRDRTRVALVRGGVVIETAGGREVAIPVSLTGNGLEPVCNRAAFSVLLKVEKEKALVAAVVKLRNSNRSA